MLGVHSATYGTVHLIIKTIRMTSFNKSPDLPQAIYTDTELNFPSHVVTAVVHSSCLPIGYDIIEPFRGYHDSFLSGIVMASVWLHPPPTHADWGDSFAPLNLLFETYQMILNKGEWWLRIGNIVC